MMENQNNRSGKNDFKSDAATWASLCHFAGLMGIVWWIPWGDMWVPVGQIIGPLAVWLVKRKTDPLVDLAGREALNFQINVTVSGLLLAIFFDSILSLAAIWSIVIAAIFMTARAGVISSRGEIYRYPFVLIHILPTRSLADTVMKRKSGAEDSW